MFVVVLSSYDFSVLHIDAQICRAMFLGRTGSILDIFLSISCVLSSSRRCFACSDAHVFVWGSLLVRRRRRRRWASGGGGRRSCAAELLRGDVGRRSAQRRARSHPPGDDLTLLLRWNVVVVVTLDSN